MQRNSEHRTSSRIFRMHWTRPWRMLVPNVPKPGTPVSSSLVLIYGFAALIILGGILLWLPISSKTGQFTPPLTSFFTSTSAVCVTGLVMVDTADYWSSFGQAIIMVLIHLGGFGFMTSATLFLLAFGRRIGLREKVLISESMGIARLGGVVKIIGLMAVYTIVLEIIGIVCLYQVFSKVYSPGMSIWLSSFQAVSAFNNAGFDLMGNFQSLVNYQDNPMMILTTAALIFLGGISFLVVADVIKTRGIRRLSLDSKIVLTTTAYLLAIGMAIVLVTEFNNNGTLGELSLPEKLMNAFFLSVTARTAGFSTIPLNQLANYALFFLMFLMFIGGASGSTAGGIKVNTFGMLTATIWGTLRGKENPGGFGREFASEQIFRALTILLISFGFIAVVVLFLTVTESFRFIDLLFETVSAFGTVGLSTGITPDLSISGQIIIMITMFIGRLGPLTLMLALVQRDKVSKYRYPQEVMRIG